MMVDELHRRQIPDGPMRALPIVFPSPGFNHDLGFLQGHKPVLVETLIPEPPIEALDEGVRDRLAGLNEAELHPVVRGPRIQGRPREFGPVIEDQARWPGLAAKSRSSIRHTRWPPIETSISMTGTALEQGSVIVKRLNRAGRWPVGHAQNPGHSSARAQ